MLRLLHEDRLERSRGTLSVSYVAGASDPPWPIALPPVPSCPWCAFFKKSLAGGLRTRAGSSGFCLAGSLHPARRRRLKIGRAITRFSEKARSDNVERRGCRGCQVRTPRGASTQAWELRLGGPRRSSMSGSAVPGT